MKALFQIFALAAALLLFVGCGGAESEPGGGETTSGGSDNGDAGTSDAPAATSGGSGSESSADAETSATDAVSDAGEPDIRTPVGAATVWVNLMAAGQIGDAGAICDPESPASDTFISIGEQLARIETDPNVSSGERAAVAIMLSGFRTSYSNVDIELVEELDDSAIVRMVFRDGEGSVFATRPEVRMTRFEDSWLLGLTNDMLIIDPSIQRRMQDQAQAAREEQEARDVEAEAQVAPED